MEWQGAPRVVVLCTALDGILCMHGIPARIFAEPGLDASVFEAAIKHALLERPREVTTQVYDVLARGNVFTSNRHILGALRVSRFSLLDSIYATQLSRDQSLLFTANRGLNHITIYNYPDTSLRLRVPMPPI